MLTIILNYIRGKLFTNAGIFFLIFGGIFAVFLFSNSSIVLSKFGFETTTTLKAQLVKSQADLVTLKLANDSLIDTVKTLNDTHARDIASIVKLQTDSNNVKKVTTNITAKKKKTESSIEQSIDSNSIYTLTTITLPTKEVTQLSVNNIDSLNETYTDLFENLSATSQTVSDIEPDQLDTFLQLNNTTLC